MIERGPWRPLLEGEVADTAWQAIREVAAALREAPDGLALSEHANLGGGRAGRAVMFTYLATALADDDFAEIAEDEFDQATEVMAQHPMPPGLYSGFSGIGWTSEHLDGRLFESEDEDEGEHEIDEALLRLLELPDWTRDYDLIKGLAGLGVYALEALPRQSARRCLELLLDHLERLAEETADGTTWHTPPQLLPPHQLEIYPEGYYNLGVAHGVPALVALLGEMQAAGVAAERVAPLLEKAVDWVLSQELESGAGSCFPSSVAAGIELQPARLAWCYGDLGVAAALLLAARCAQRADWQEEALRIARDSARRPPETAGVVDAGLCHGSAGLGHLYNRIYQATGEELFADAARHWFGEALASRQAGEGFGGYLSWSSDADLNRMWQPDDGFLTGAAGIVLALLGAVTPIEPMWDRVLLCSIPPRL